MIQANELRIGNYIYEQTLRVVPANFVNKRIISVAHINEERFPNDITNQYAPIPLTPEILIKAGFSEAIPKDGTLYIECTPALDLLGITWHEDDVFVHVNGDDVRLSEIKYLHQLQNLYFALTNKELEINLD